MRFIIFTFLGLFIFSATHISASIVDTRHNLSVSNSVVPDANETIIMATEETEICVFCHVPHFAQAVGKPLWNRSMPASAYTMYSSDYLRRLDYPIATELGSANDTPGALSRQCLSCHDGTIAVGAVSKLRSSNDVTIGMDGVEGDGTIPTSAVGFFGTDLTKHHPIGIEYDSTKSIAFGDATRTIELKATPDSPIKLYEYAGYPDKKYVECSSCHDPHKEGGNASGESGKFLHVDSDTKHGLNVVATCTSCHEKDGWDTSVHQSAVDTGGAAYTDPAVLAKYGTDKVSELGCANCHTPHNAEGVPYLNRKQLGNTCFQGAASTIDGAACHGIGGAKDIQSQLFPEKAYSHPVVASSSGDTNHTNLDTLYGWQGGLEMDDGTSAAAGGMSWGTNKHSVCMDCHNQHQSKPGTHVPDGQWYPNVGESTNLTSASGPLTGVPGIVPSWPALWTQPTTFTTTKESTYEYQICLKCHSYWGMGPAVNGINTGGHYSPSVPTQLLTDVAWEMNINNRSGHPVIIQQDDRPKAIDGGDGSAYLPLNLNAVQLLPPWQLTSGTNTMYCSDCHGSDTEGTAGQAKGPHGSNLKYLLKGENQSWPAKPGTATLYTMDDLIAVLDATDPTATDDLFCKNCHDPNYPHTQWRNNMAGRGFTCVTCHVTIPHGSPVSRLIGYKTFPEPYNYGGNSLLLDGWAKQVYDTANTGVRTNAYGSTCGGSMGCHGSDNGATVVYDGIDVHTTGYDTNEMP